MIKFEDIREGDTVTAKMYGVTVIGIIRKSLTNELYFDLGGHHAYLRPDDFVSAERQLPTKPGSIIYRVQIDDLLARWAVLGEDDRWYTEDGTIVLPGEIIRWEV